MRYIAVAEKNMQAIKKEIKGIITQTIQQKRNKKNS